MKSALETVVTTELLVEFFTEAIKNRSFRAAVREGKAKEDAGNVPEIMREDTAKAKCCAQMESTLGVRARNNNVNLVKRKEEEGDAKSSGEKRTREPHLTPNQQLFSFRVPVSIDNIDLERFCSYIPTVFLGSMAVEYQLISR